MSRMPPIAMLRYVAVAVCGLGPGYRSHVGACISALPWSLLTALRSLSPRFRHTTFADNGVSVPGDKSWGF